MNACRKACRADPRSACSEAGRVLRRMCGRAGVSGFESGGKPHRWLTFTCLQGAGSQWGILSLGLAACRCGTSQCNRTHVRLDCACLQVFHSLEVSRIFVTPDSYSEGEG